MTTLLAMAAAVTTGLGWSWSSRNIENTIGWVSHRHEVQAAVQEVLALLQDAEIGERRFLRSADPADLAPLETTGPELAGRLGALQQMTADDVAQQHRLERLQALAADRMQLLGQVVAFARQGEHDRAIALLARGRDRQLMDAARVEIAAIQAEERRRLGLRLAEVDRARGRTAATAVLTTGLLLALMAAGYASSSRANARVRGALAATEDSERRYRSLAEALPDMLWTATPDLQPTYFNPQWKRFTGDTRDQLSFDEWVQFIHPEDRPAFQQTVREPLGRGQTHQARFRLRRHDGQWRWVAARATPLRDAGGSLLQWVGTVTDIHDRWQADQALRQSQALVQAIVDGATALVFAKDLDGRYFLTNRAWRDLAGLAPEQAQGVTDAQVFGESVARRLAETDRQVVRSGEAVLTEEGAMLHGRAATFLSSKFPLRKPSGEVYAVCGVATDITELKVAREQVQQLNADLEQRVAQRTRQLSEANQQLEAFSYTVSHDLRAPLRGVQGFAQAMVEDYADRLDPQGREYLDRIRAAARRMERLIQDLLEYGRLSREQLPVRDCSLEQAMQEALAQLAPDIELAQAEVQVQQPLPDVRGHPAVLQQILGNLLGNALKFVAPGERPRVRVWAQAQDGCVRTFVQDQGIGIRPEHQDRIFEMFERLHGQEAFAGTGVGLAIVRKACERLGGRCGIDSGPGGSTFWFELDAARGAP